MAYPNSRAKQTLSQTTHPPNLLPCSPAVAKGDEGGDTVVSPFLLACLLAGGARELIASTSVVLNERSVTSTGMGVLAQHLIAENWIYKRLLKMVWVKGGRMRKELNWSLFDEFWTNKQLLIHPQSLNLKLKSRQLPKAIVEALAFLTCCAYKRNVWFWYFKSTCN